MIVTRVYIDTIIWTVVGELGGGEAAYYLILRTGDAESGYRTRKQYGGGPARGFWQMEPATERDIWENYISYRPSLKDKLHATVEPGDDLENSDLYACAMCRLHYLRVPESLPAADDIDAQARYWKAHYNTATGKGTVEHFIKSATIRLGSRDENRKQEAIRRFRNPRSDWLTW